MPLERFVSPRGSSFGLLSVMGIKDIDDFLRLGPRIGYNLYHIEVSVPIVGRWAITHIQIVMTRKITSCCGCRLILPDTKRFFTYWNEFKCRHCVPHSKYLWLVELYPSVGRRFFRQPRPYIHLRVPCWSLTVVPEFDRSRTTILGGFGRPFLKPHSESFDSGWNFLGIQFSLQLVA